MVKYSKKEILESAGSIRLVLFIASIVFLFLGAIEIIPPAVLTYTTLPLFIVGFILLAVWYFSEFIKK